MKNPRKYLFIFFLLYYNYLFSVTISEILYETSASKNFNQVLEIYNNTSSRVKLTDYFFTSGARTNKIILLPVSKQKDFTFLNGIFTNEYLAPNQVAIILDSGYKKEVTYDFNHSPVFTITTSSLSPGRFLKEGEMINLFDENKHLVDRWTLKEVLLDESLTKIDFTRLGTEDNLLPVPPNLGVITALNITTDSPASIVLQEVNNARQIIGIPQSYRFKCERNGILAVSCNREIQLKDYENARAKLYFYPNSNKNLVDPEDFIPLSAGLSPPLTLWPLNKGKVTFAYQENITADATLMVNDFDSDLKGEIFINEIFYNATNKNLVWLEIYFANTLTTDLEIHLWNSDFAFKKSIAIPETTYQKDSYQVFAYKNPDFIKQFAWHNNVADTGEIIDITAEGVIALKNNTGYIDSAYYQKNWFADNLDGRSLQRKTIAGYAFTRDNFDFSLDKKMTPQAKNDFSKNINFNVTLENTLVTRNKEHIAITLDYPVSGELSVFIYDPAGNLMGRVLYIAELSELADPKKINLCLEKANLIIPGLYQLSFIYQTDYGSKIMLKKFAYQN